MVTIVIMGLHAGETYESLQYLYRIPSQTIGKIVPETCAAIIDGLSEYMKVNIITNG
jgi:hypothetical protein